MNSALVEEYLGVAETARLLAVHENTIRNWVRTGVLRSAKLPGARAHRFARSEVEQLLRDRGAATSSVGRSLRQDGPELAGSIELDQWAARSDSKTAFPELMDRLLSRTPGVANVNVRSHEGTAAHGWDGTAVSSGATFLPDGNLYFEFGTNEAPEAKAEKDYESRRGVLGSAEGAHFVFVTPRNWPGGKKWATTKSSLNEYASVEVIDAHRLASWLREVPQVHQWISERLGFRPHDAQTLGDWWEHFQSEIRLRIPATFFTAGRSGAVQQLLQQLSEGSGTITIRGADQSEDLAFLYAGLGDDDRGHSVVLVRGVTAWRRLIASTTPLVLVPLFREADHGLALKSGHRVVLLAGEGEVVRGVSIELGRINPLDAGEALDKAGVVYGERARLVSLARKNMRAFLRELSPDPRLVKPEWVRDIRVAHALGRLLLSSSWDKTEADHAALERLTGLPWADLDLLLRQQERQDGVFVRSGDTWQLSAPTDAAALLLPELSPEDVGPWTDVVRDVLTAVDPFLGMNTSERLAAQMSGTGSPCSPSLRRGLALSLALAANSEITLHGVGSFQSIVDGILRRIWADAEADASGKLWQSLRDVMPLLAEAGPDVFLDAVDADLDSSKPALRFLFTDEHRDLFFGPSSPHTGLLWALETLTWSRAHFARAVDALVRIAEIDPGGRLVNRPLKSLQEVLVGWLRNSGGTTADKIAALESMTAAHPTVARNLLIALMPELHPISSPPQLPTYRDWAPGSNAVTMSDWVDFVAEVARLSTSIAGTDGEMWAQLIERCDKLPRSNRSDLLATLRTSVATSNWTADALHLVWRALDEKVRRHEEYADADWALGSADVAALREAAAALPVGRDPRRFAGLFGWRRTFEGLRFDDEGYREALGRAQAEAVEEVLRHDGVDALVPLIVAVKNAQALGSALAATPAACDVKHEVVRWLDSAHENLQTAAGAFISIHAHQKGWTWLESVLDEARALSEVGQARFMAAIPFRRVFWAQLDQVAPDLAPLYWNQSYPVLGDGAEFDEAANRLIEEKHPWAAIALISNALHGQDPEVTVTIVRRALQAAISVSGPIRDTNMTPYHVEQVLDYMERAVPDDEDLPSFEFMLFGLLHDQKPTTALYSSLNRRPDDFVDMMTAMFRAEGEEGRTLSVGEQNYLHRAWDVLHHWRVIPGQAPDGTVDAEHLNRWVQDARLALEERGRLSVGDEQIGELLAASPVGADGLWPAEAVRDLLETTGSVRLEAGVQIGRRNLRGIVSKSVFEGGEQERQLQREYEEFARAMGGRWRRTSRVLRAIADSYGREAQREDEEAERDADRD